MKLTLITIIYLSSAIIEVLYSFDEYKYTYLQTINELPLAAVKMRKQGFNDDFLGSDLIMTTLLDDEGKSVYPLPWHSLEYNSKKIYSKKDLNQCKKIEETKYDCFLFILIMQQAVIQQRYAYNYNKKFQVFPSHLTMTFLYHYCRKLAQNLEEFKYDRKAFCPNACHNKTNYCQRIPHTKYGKCKVDPDKPFYASGFQCVCSEGYIWSKGSKICIKEMTREIVNTHKQKCHKFNTKELISRNGVVKCQCKPQFYGDECRKIKDACITSVNRYPPGNVACQVHKKGNVCISGSAGINKLPYYTCKCDKSHGDRFKKSIDGFEGYVDTCIPDHSSTKSKKSKQRSNRLPCGLICQNGGTCVSLITVDNEVDTIKTKCICKPGYVGRLCGIGHQTPAPNTLTPWSQWTLCQPLCGEGRVRTRYRMSLTLTNSAAHTSGTMDGRDTQVRPCRPRPCVRYRKASSRDKFILNIQNSDEKRPEIEIVNYIMIVLVASNIFVAALVVQNRLIRPFLKYVTSKAEKKMSKMKSVKKSPILHFPPRPLVPPLPILPTLSHLSPLSTLSPLSPSVYMDDLSGSWLYYDDDVYFEDYSPLSE